MKYFVLLALLWAGIVEAKPSGQYVQDSMVKAAKEVGVPVVLLKSICFAESAHRAEAYAFQDGNATNHAFGLCQVLYNTAVGLGSKKDEGCRADYRTEKEQRKAGIKNPVVLERSYKTCRLFGPYTNAYYAAKYLKQKLEQYDNSWISAIAAYNTGTLRTCKTGKVHDSKGRLLYTCKKGGLLNQKYVDRVLDALADISAEKAKELKNE